MYSSSLFPQITSLTHIGTKSKALADNIVSTDSPEEPISGNTITFIPDCLAQFLLFLIEKTKNSKIKETYRRNFPQVFYKINVLKYRKKNQEKICCGDCFVV